MKELVIVTNLFPKLTETFVARQVDFLKGNVVTKIFDKAACSLFAIDYSAVFELNAHANKNLLRLDELYKKMRYRLFNTPAYYWYPGHQSTFEHYLKEKNIKVVLAEFGPLGINCLPVCKKLKIPLIVQFFGYDASSLLQNKTYVRDIKQVLSYASKIIVLNSIMKKTFMQLGYPENKIAIINVGVPVDEIVPGIMPEGKDFQFLSVGRMVPKKSPLDVVKAFELCADGNPHVRLNMVGDGPLENQVIEHLKTSKHKDKVALLGNLSQAALKPYYQSANVFLQHSVTAENGDTEGWPVGIAEACAFGLPIISTKHTGIMDQVVHGQTGYLVDEHDYKKMGEYMLSISLNMKLCKEMGKASREFVEKNGNLKTQIKKLKDLISAEIK